MRKYLHNFLDKHPQKVNVVKSEKSTYYKIGNKVVRVSDHIAVNSSGSISIVIPVNSTKTYIIHLPSNGKIIYFDNFTKLKQFLVSYLLYVDLVNPNPTKKDKIKLGVPEKLSKILEVHSFSKNQLKQINNFIKK